MSQAARLRLIMHEEGSCPAAGHHGPVSEKNTHAYTHTYTYIHIYIYIHMHIHLHVWYVMFLYYDS